MEDCGDGESSLISVKVEMAPKLTLNCRDKFVIRHLTVVGKLDALSLTAIIDFTGKENCTC